jgi:REP element-mobilizing transposase RayT
MPRKARLFISGATYHVYCGVARGEFVFEDASNTEVFIDTLRDVRDRDGLSVLAWCLMTNHYHVVMKTGSVPLWRSMARLQGKTAREHNRKRQVLGRLWQSRYRARVVDSNDYFRQVVAYVHLNPVAAGLVTDPADYHLSGHREAVGLRGAFILDVENLLGVFGTANPAEMRAEYLRWVRLVAEERRHENGLADLPWWKEASNQEEIANPHRHRGAETYDQRRATEDRVHIGLEELFDAFEHVTGMTVRDLRSTKRGPSLPSGRIDLTAIAVGRFGHRVCDVADRLKKNPGTVSRWFTKADRRSQYDPEYLSHLDDLDVRITDQTGSKVIK